MACAFLNPSHLPAPRLPNPPSLALSLSTGFPDLDFGGYGGKQYHFCYSPDGPKNSLRDLPVAVDSLPIRYVETLLRSQIGLPPMSSFQGPSPLRTLILMLRLAFGFRTLKLILHHNTRSLYAAAPTRLSPTALLSGTGIYTRVSMNAPGFGNVMPPIPHNMKPCAISSCKRSGTGQGIFLNSTARPSVKQSFLNFKLFADDIGKGSPLGNFLLILQSFHPPVYPLPSSMPSFGRVWSGCVQCRCCCTLGLPGD